jgi:hypothetical protein
MKTHFILKLIETGMDDRSWLKNMKKRVHFGVRRVNVRIILKRTLIIYSGRMRTGFK